MAYNLNSNLGGYGGLNSLSGLNLGGLGGLGSLQSQVGLGVSQLPRGGLDQRLQSGLGLGSALGGIRQYGGIAEARGYVPPGGAYSCGLQLGQYPGALSLGAGRQIPQLGQVGRLF